MCIRFNSEIIGKWKMRRLVGSRIKLRIWGEIKFTVHLYFSDQRNIDCLVQDLTAFSSLQQNILVV